MAREKKLEPPGDDIPAWFMTYSDVITLLMTFFILLLTFSTTEPDRFEKVQQAVFAGGNATGIVGDNIAGPEKDSFIQRTRPRAARIAMNGSEMPPYMKEPSRKAVGRGLKQITPEEDAKDVMVTNFFEVALDTIVDDKGNLTSRGAHVAGLMATQLRSVPVNLCLQFSDPKHAPRATVFATYLYHTEQIRPGQVGLGLADDVTTDSVRFVIERFEE